MKVHLADFLAAVGDVSRGQLERACPFPALLDLGQEPSGCADELLLSDPPAVQRRVRIARLRAALARGADLSLLVLAPEEDGAPVAIGRAGLLDPSVSPAQARLRREGRTWHLEALAGQTLVEGQPLQPGRSQPLLGGQQVQLGERRTLFLTPVELHLLVSLANGAETHLVLPPLGVLLADLRRLIRSPNAPGPSSPPFLVEVPVEGPGPAAGSAATQALEPEEGDLPRAPSDAARIHSVVMRKDPDGATVVVGRHDDCDLVVTDSTVSKHHARLQRSAEGWLVTDLGSQNGTFVRDEHAPAHVKVPLRSGDRLRFGSHRCVFLEPEDACRMLAHLASRLSG